MPPETLKTNLLAMPPSSGAGAAHVFTDEEDHALVQRRLGLVYGIMGALVLFFWVVGVVLVGATMPERFWAFHLSAAKILHLVTGLGLLGVWRLCLGPLRPRWLLSVMDVVGALKTMTIASLVVALTPVGLRAEFIGLAPLTLFACLRAALVPSPPRWTALVALVAALPLPAGGYVAALRDPTWPEALVPRASVVVLEVAWCVGAVVGAFAIAKVVYGLRAEVKSAMRLGQYTLEEKIGEGGMGAVYRARHALLRRPTAVKLLAPERNDRTHVQRFEREVQLTSMLTHPNTIAIYDFGHTRDGVFYYAMELLDGVSLEELVDKEGPQAPGRVVHILAQVAGALAEAHDAGLIHRDVKPANVFLCARAGTKDFVKVLDFGLVKQVDSTDPALSRADAIAGTPLYMAPESITDAGGIDARVDIYALGGVAYWLLTGTAPFDGANLVEICSHHLHTPVEPPSKRLGAAVPQALEDLVLRCLAKSRDERPSSAADLLGLLRACQEQLPWDPENLAANHAAQ